MEMQHLIILYFSGVTMEWSLFAQHEIAKLSNNFQMFMLFCENNPMNQKTINSSMTYYVHVLVYNTAKQMFRYIIVSKSLIN
jgi:hypothetical protein